MQWVPGDHDAIVEEVDSVKTPIRVMRENGTEVTASTLGRPLPSFWWLG